MAMSSSGGHSDDVGPEFYATIRTRIAALEEEITDLDAIADDDPDQAITALVIKEKVRAIQHLQGFLPTIPQPRTR
jgi:hypothetical protein